MTLAEVTQCFSNASDRQIHRVRHPEIIGVDYQEAGIRRVSKTLGNCGAAWIRIALGNGSRDQ